MEERLERQARNEALVREVNERINALDRDAAGSGAVKASGRSASTANAGARAAARSRSG